jgi:uncharacterized membrane protein YcaP (DUF421 family)
MQAMGRKYLSQLSAFELVLLVVMGDLIQQGVTQQDSSLVGAMLAVGTFVVWILALSYVSYKFKKARDVLEGQPVVLVRDGRPVPKMIDYQRLTVDDVKDAAREQGIGDLRLVQVGMLESDGKFSFVRYDDAAPHEDEEAAES